MHFFFAVIATLTIGLPCQVTWAAIRSGGPRLGPQMNQLQRKSNSGRGECSADIVLMYQDCKICSCSAPGKHPKCFRKSCDLRTKSTGQCPSTVLRIEDYAKCKWSPDSQNYAGVCKTDLDCPGNMLCCFDFCKGSICMPPVPWTESKVHPGRGYP